MVLFNQIYCIDYNGWVTGASPAPPPKQVDFSSQTIPELIYSRASSDRVAAIFDAEKLSLTFAKVMEALAAGLLSTGLAPGDRILICGSNHSQVWSMTKIFPPPLLPVFLSALAASRAGLVFSLANPNFADGESFQRALKLGEFRAVICFRVPGSQDYLHSLLIRITPELMHSHKGRIRLNKKEICLYVPQ
ncbi:unnamed protein product [Cylicostephanus goldi]|uniref:AMP-dependent synthetase/ligase domain-containing protein n=1 Tax=Cylicostephanus goldi TaxID=71465 RepID=A0A3P7NZR2_CYLGO|nr:unnamed protein product [Cylicostephanus goldi]